jgi:hypothetical protein
MSFGTFTTWAWPVGFRKLFPSPRKSRREEDKRIRREEKRRASGTFL